MPYQLTPRLLTVAATLSALFVGTAALAQDPSRTDRRQLLAMRKLLFEAPLIDGHNDVPWQTRERLGNVLGEFNFSDTSALQPPMHTDLARLELSGLGGQFWSVYIPTSMAGPGATRAVLEQIDVVHRLVDKYPQQLQIALTSTGVDRARRAGRLASLIGMEGGHAIDNSLGALRQLYRAGVRYMTLTHSANTDWADSATDEAEHNGLSSFGLEVVREMNRMGMLVDLSHTSPATMHDALDTVRAPVIFSHSSAYGVTQHARNVPDDVLRRVANNGGVVMVTFVPSFISEDVRRHSDRARLERLKIRNQLTATFDGEALDTAVNTALDQWRTDNPAPNATLKDVADHIDHIRAIASVDIIGIGGDYDGITSVPVGLEDVSQYPALFLELRARGYSDRELKAIAGGNILRAMRAAEKVAADLISEPASDMVFGRN